MRRGGPFLLICSRRFWWLCLLDQACHWFTPHGIDRICERHDRALIALWEEDDSPPPSKVGSQFWIGNTTATNSTVTVRLDG